MKNCVTTKCNHSFHSSCLMQNVAINGFTCPCCRAIMAERNTTTAVRNDSIDRTIHRRWWFWNWVSLQNRDWNWDSLNRQHGFDISNFTVDR